MNYNIFNTIHVPLSEDFFFYNLKIGICYLFLKLNTINILKLNFADHFSFLRWWSNRHAKSGKQGTVSLANQL